MKDTIIWVEVEESKKERLLLKCFKMKVPVLETKIENSKFFIKIYESDYPKLKKLWFVKVKKSNVTGWALVKQVLWSHRIFILAVLFGLILLYIISHIMVSVDVIHSNKEIRELVRLTLKEKGIKENTFRKSYKEIKQIKKEILDLYPDKLEWLEIEVHGMNYTVRIEERKLESEKETKSSCHIVATKDALVKEMVFSKGMANVKTNDSVKKGDILISGLIKKDEEVKDIVCAEGSVYGEVWYTITASVPMEYKVSTRTNKRRWNFRFKNLYVDDFIFRSRLETYEEEKKPILNLFGNELIFVIQHETKEEIKKYTEEEAKNKAVEEGIAKLKSTLDEKERIMYQKVLKNEVNNSTMNVEIFVSVLENIGEVQEFDENIE